MTTQRPVLGVEDLSIHRPDEVPLLEKISLNLYEKEIVLLVGPSGSGKSTLINLMAGLLDFKDGWKVSGSLNYHGERYDLSRHRVAAGGVVFQHHALFDDLTVGENLTIAADHGDPGNEPLMRVSRVLLSGMHDDMVVANCSGGQKQRAAIARTLLANRPILFFDEPNSGLDVWQSRRFAELVHHLCQSMHKPAIIVAHHFQQLMPMVNRVLLLDPEQRRLDVLPPDAELVESRLSELMSAIPEEDLLPPLPDAPRAFLEGIAGTAAVDAAEAADGEGSKAGARDKQPPVPLTPREKMRRRERQRPTSLAQETSRPQEDVERTAHTDVRARLGLGWFLFYLERYIWLLCFSPAMMAFLMVGGAVVGFVSTWFTFQYMPYKEYLTALLHHNALSGVGVVVVRIFAPLMASVLVAARNSAVIAADIGNRVYSSQISAMRNLNIPHITYLGGSILISMTVAAAVLYLVMLMVAFVVGLETWKFIFPTASEYLWREQYFRKLMKLDGIYQPWMTYEAIKIVASGVVTAIVSVLFGIAPKRSVLDINTAVAHAIIVSIALVLIIHAGVALFEFKSGDI